MKQPITKTDGDLLTTFVATRCQESFEELVTRHGSMVHEACRRVLNSGQGSCSDEDDIVQAVFLTLAQKAKSLRGHHAIAGWLHQVTVHIALRKRTETIRRRNREQEAGNRMHQDAADPKQLHKLKELVDDALNDLPLRYRTPLILFHFEGYSLEETAQQLNCKPGTLDSWLHRGRQMLRIRLQRQGMTLSASGLIGLLPELSAAPLEKAIVLNLTDAVYVYAQEVETIGGVISESAIQLTKGVLRTMMIKKLTVVSTVILACAALGTVAITPIFSHANENLTVKNRTHNKKIVFTSDRGGTWNIWVMDEGGNNPKQLTKATKTETDIDPVFSPDLKRILFTSSRGGTTGLWIMNADGSKSKRICNGDQAEWAPDNNQIVFRRNGKIVTRHLESNLETNLTPANWRSTSPSWSPDGKTIAFAARPTEVYGLYLIPSTGGKPKVLYNKVGACDPHWSPDSKLITYQTSTHIYTIQINGSNNQQITGFGGVQRFARFSPNGKRIVFAQGTSEKGPWQIYSISLDTNNLEKISNLGSNMYPDWR